uniref:WGS project CAEQ00000000 data, annotated contig 1446 n=1 Tax=Trypanosoma congolense (strain IL3000) TaxID=1068625 RepID=F9W6C0_TRYCI|nr:unnamed protein product [Trypanosoma congolense IL3000]
MWCRSEDLGHPVTFLLQDGDGVATEPVSLLDSVLHCVRDAIGKGDICEAAGRVYSPLLVYVSLLDDPCQVPSDLNDECTVIVDEWSPLHLAIILQREDVVSAILEFHWKHGPAVLEGVLSRRKMCLSAPAAPGTVANVPEPVLARGGGVGRALHRGRHEMGGAMVVFQDSPDGVGTSGGDGDGCLDAVCGSTTCEAVEWLFDSSCVTGALRPLLTRIMWEKSLSGDAANDVCGENGTNDGPSSMREGSQSTPSESHFAESAVRRLCAGVDFLYCPLPSILVDFTVMYSTCKGDMGSLMDIMGLFNGMLLPVLQGRPVHAQCGSGSVAECDVDAVLRQPPDNSADCNRTEGQQHFPNQQTARQHFFFFCAAQEHQRLAFLTMWLLSRVAVLKKYGNCESDIADAAHQLLSTKSVPVDASATSEIHSAHLFFLMQLASGDCTLEDFVDLATAVNETQPPGCMPIVFVAALVAGSVAAAFPERGPLLLSLSDKLKALQEITPQAGYSLREYASLPTRNEAERFNELWLGATPLSSMEKFTSRADMLYFALVELVLRGAEKKWSSPESPSNTESRTEAERALSVWLHMCQALFSTPVNEEGDVTYCLSTIMKSRLEEGAPPCCALYHSLYPEDAAAARATEGEGAQDQDSSHGAGDSHHGEDLEALFLQAQHNFTRVLGSVSNESKLCIYALYKQATVGDINISRPWLTDMVGRAKWDAWNKLKGLGCEAAKKQYVSKVRELFPPL